MVTFSCWQSRIGTQPLNPKEVVVWFRGQYLDLVYNFLQPLKQHHITRIWADDLYTDFLGVIRDGLDLAEVQESC